MGGTKGVRQWIETGSPWIWLTAGMVSLNLVMVFGLLGLIAMRGLGHFWPTEITSLQLAQAVGGQTTMLGEMVDHEVVSAARLRAMGELVPEDMEEVDRYLIKVGNRDITGFDFRWVTETNIVARDHPPDVLVAEREEWGNVYGFLIEVRERGVPVGSGQTAWGELGQRLARKRELREAIRHIEKSVIGGINYDMERLRLRRHRLELDGVTDAARFETITRQRGALQAQYDSLNSKLADLYDVIARDTIVVRTIEGKEAEIPVAKLVRVFRPNQMRLSYKIRHYFRKIWEFISEDPREANTEGGVFPAIYGTMLMVIVMSILVSPFGIMAAVYLHEYAKQGPITRVIRIAVNNLAGVPSVVYGVFALGFFVYFLGGRIDQLFFPEALPAPTFGTPGLLWSSLTLALLTVPVVIVATEEGLARIPREIRDGSLALGATKAETLWRTVLPMAAPAMITGLILAIARAAGEVAPLMMVGVVKLAPSLPLDGNFPFLHLDRKFMHLGFHIYDVGFQSPNVEAARPLVYATSLLLVILIVVLNLGAIRIRSRLRDKYNASSH